MNTVESVGAGPAGDDVSLPLSVAVAAFLAEKSAELSPYSVIHLRASLSPLVVALDDPPAGAVAYADLRGYVDGLHLRYRPGTIGPIVGDVRQFFRWAKKRRLIPRNPAKRLRMPSRRATQAAAHQRAAPESDVRRVLDAMAGRLARIVWRDLFGNLTAAPVDEWRYDERQTARDLFILSFLYETGARAGELWRLSCRAMDDAAASPGPVYSVVSTGKTGAALLRFTAATLEAWAVWRGVHPGGEHAVVGWQPWGRPGPMSTSTLSRMLSRQCDRAGVGRFRAHALRHAKIRRINSVAGLEVAARLVGHSSAIVTAGYARPDDDELDAAALATGLARRLWGGT